MRTKLRVWCLASLLLVTLTACQSQQLHDSLPQSAETVMTDLLAAADTELPSADWPNWPLQPVTSVEAPLVTGLTVEEFETWVAEGWVVRAPPDQPAYQVLLLRLSDITAAAMVKDKLAAQFNAWQWGENNLPGRGSVINSGSYVLMTITSFEAGDALMDSFIRLAENNAGQMNDFFPPNVIPKD
ncbi:MAG: hypothetical protein LBL92_07350 [Propionibacteriaceae bacterium]|jgi:hypothetical protein|nr:hypothetical protein [Propionibacteriaceae bacterium]